MNKMMNVLSLINEPRRSRKYIEYNLGLAKDLKAGLRLLYTQDLDMYPLGTPGSVGNEVVEVQINLEKITEAGIKTIRQKVSDIAKKTPLPVRVTYDSYVGNTIAYLEEFAKKETVYMLTLEESLEGDGSYISDKTDILRQFILPVLIIPKDRKYSGFRKIVYATDYHEEDIPALKKVISMARKFNPQITILHITEEHDFEEKVKSHGFIEMVREKTAYKNITSEIISEPDSAKIPEIINEYALAKKADLTVLLKEDKGFFDRIFTRSTTNRLVKDVRVPLLIFHEKE